MYSKDCSSRLNFQEKQSYASKCSYKESSVTITLTFVLEKNRKWMKGGFISNSASTMFTTLFGWKAKKISITATLDFFAAIFNAKKVANELCILLSTTVRDVVDDLCLYPGINKLPMGIKNFHL
uniref:Uncharacterized protein n=1 Tax=Glossina austeni TaxID=7395 RepID=A0A1A9V6E4_GLOAU